MKFDINFQKKNETFVLKNVYYIYYSIFFLLKLIKFKGTYICKFQFDSIFFLER